MNIEKLLGRIEESAGEEVKQESLDEIWYRFQTPSGEYYSPFIKSKSNLVSFPNVEDLVEAMNKKDNYEVLSDNLAKIYTPSQPTNSPEALPNGVYSHEYGSSGIPERLIPTEIRQDSYVDLMESLSNLDSSIDNFIQNKQLYDDSQSIYKLGVLLFGPPGTGKTSYLRKFIKKREAIVIFLDGVPSRKFLEKLEKSTKNRLKILVFEEAVSLLESSDDVREMLDFLDGSRSVSNSIYFLSTNYPEAIPENIIRNGRIDLFVRVEYPSSEARSKLIALYLKREASSDELKLTENMPIVDIREICFQHKKTGKSFQECGKLIEEKNKMLKKHFGKTREIRLT
jgi:predicted AAA+ superfamily ATPase